MLKLFIKETPFGISIFVMALTFGLFVLIAPIGGNKALIVRSGSMQPTIGVGDLITVRPKPEYKVGDIIAFKDLAKSSIIVSHRIVSVKNQDGRVFYQTKGDANKDADFNLVPAQNVVGSTWAGIKGAGRIFAFTKTKTGFLTLIVIPALFVIFSEVLNILKEIKKSRNHTPQAIYRSARKHLYHHYGKPMGLPHPSTSFRSLFSMLSLRGSKGRSNLENRSLLRLSPDRDDMIGIGFKSVLPVLATLFIVGSTFAFFSDAGTSTNNTFAASACFASTSHIVINEVFYDVNTGHTGTGSEGNWEWVELFNPTTSPVSLTGWSISDSNSSDTFPGTPSIPACGFAIVSPSTGAQLTDQTTSGGRWTIPDGTVFITLSSAIGNGLNNNGDSVILKNAAATIIDQMSYGTDTSVFNPSATDVASGHSLERNPRGKDTDAASDFVDRTTPTPGS